MKDTSANDPKTTASIERLDVDRYTAAIPELAALLVETVDGGATVNFMAGLSLTEAVDWWRERIDLVADGTVTPIVAVDADGRIVGSTVIVRSRIPNSPHRAEIVKVMVQERARRQGLGRALMAAAEETARADGRWLLILDTVSGSAAEALYRSMGWQEVGVMPDHSYRPDGVLQPTTFFWKDLR